MSERTRPRSDLRADRWGQSNTAQVLAAVLSDFCFRKRIYSVDPQTRAELMQLAEECVSKAVDEHALPIEAAEPDCMDAWRELRDKLNA